MMNWLTGICSMVLVMAMTMNTSAQEPQLAHMVYFKLKDSSEAARQQLVDLCHEHLADHDGIVYFSVGVIAEELDREVNDRGFDVALHLVFKDKSAHDQYQTHPRHLKFIEQGRESWESVRVFDSYIKAAKPKR